VTRVAFTLFGGHGWTGGLNYLRNLLAALADLPGRPVQAVLFVAPDTSNGDIVPLRPWLAQAPVVVPGWAKSPRARAQRLVQSMLLQDDRVSSRAFREQGIDVVFQHAAWYGLRFDVPTLAWIADFQHRHLPGMFSRANRVKRDLGYAALSHSACALMVSSDDAAADARRFFPACVSRLVVVPFCVSPPDPAAMPPRGEVPRRYALNERYVYFPGQLWRHKNHLLLVRALALLRQQGRSVVVAMTGQPADSRNPQHPATVLRAAQAAGLESSFRFLGMVPYGDVMPLMREARALLNPSLFEGWSTTVEEAKALGVPMVLSSLEVHREQAGAAATYFDPQNPEALAAALWQAWQNEPLASDVEQREARALAAYGQARRAFAERFASVVQAVGSGRAPTPGASRS